MKPWLRGCLAATAVVGVLLLVGGVLLAPRAIELGGQMVVPVVRMERSGRRLEELQRTSTWTRPATDALSGADLDRFLRVRRTLAELYERLTPRFEKFPKGKGDLREGLQVLDTMGELLPGQMTAFVDEGMTPAEYHYIERLVYGRWRTALRTLGTPPEAFAVASDLLEQRAAEEPDAAIGIRLRAIAEELACRKPPSPPGFDPAIHALLLTRLDRIERYSLDAYRDVPIPPPP